MEEMFSVISKIKSGNKVLSSSFLKQHILNLVRGNSWKELQLKMMNVKSLEESSCPLQNTYSSSHFNNLQVLTKPQAAYQENWQKVRNRNLMSKACKLKQWKRD